MEEEEEDEEDEDASWEVRICRMPEVPPLPVVLVPAVLELVLAGPGALDEGGKARHAHG